MTTWKPRLLALAVATARGLPAHGASDAERIRMLEQHRRNNRR